jgi:Kef-type K+ transport system membrane component KefB
MYDNFADVSAAVERAESAVGASAEQLTVNLLCQLAVILAVTRITVWFARRFLKQTDVAGEILAGLLLGPGALGAFFPRIHAELFRPQTSTIFVGIAQIGLILLMFQIGLEFEFKKNIGGDVKKVFMLSLSGIIAPFALGYLLAPSFWNTIAEPRPNLMGFRLFMAIAMSITAIPILGRIMVELGLSHTRIASLTIAAAAVDDVVGWVLLSIVSAIVAANFAVGPLIVRLIGLGIFLFVVFAGFRPLAKRYIARRLVGTGMQKDLVSVGVLALLLAAIWTSRLGVFAIIGGFTLGVAIHDERRFVDIWKRSVEPLVFSFFLPVFFAYTGLRTNIGALATPDAIVRCLAVIAIAFVGKFGAAYLTSRMFGGSHREAATLGICMNTRALMELVVINVGHDLGVLPQEMFTSLVIMAIVSTFIATPLIAYLQAGERKFPTSIAETDEPALGPFEQPAEVGAAD